MRKPDATERKLRAHLFERHRSLKSALRRRRARSWLSFQEPEALFDLGSKTMDVESRDLLRRLYALLDRLSPRDRLVFSLRHIEAMTHDEIASAMNVSVSTVKRSVNYASSRVRRWIRADLGLTNLLDERGFGP